LWIPVIPDFSESADRVQRIFTAPDGVIVATNGLSNFFRNLSIDGSAATNASTISVPVAFFARNTKAAFLDLSKATISIWFR
jgi:hypothetical protein